MGRASVGATGIPITSCIQPDNAMKHQLYRFTFVLLTVLSLLALPASVLAQGSITFFVTNVDASQFPDVKFDLRAIDLNNQAVANLSSANVAVYENGQQAPDVQVLPRTDGPVNIIFVIDLGQFANYQIFGLNNVRLAISTLVTGGYFKDGIDTVTVLGRQNSNGDQTLVLLPTTSTGLTLSNWVANFNFQRGSGKTKGLLGVEEAMAEMSKQVPTPGGETAAIIYLGRYIEDPNTTVATSSAQNLALTAKEKHITVYTFQTDLSKFNSQPLQVLATGANGVYLPLDRNTVATSTGNIYQAITAQRTVYTVSYRSQLGESGTRQITINSPAAPSAGLAGSYEVTVEPPSVQITEPNPDSTILREAKPNADGTYSYDLNEVTVTADINWPSGASPRNITSAELFVNGATQDRIEPPAGATQVEFKWDISDVAAEGINTLNVEVRVTDELNVQASGETTVNIDVIPPPAPPPEDPTVVFFKKYGIIIGSVVCVGLLGVAVVMGIIWGVTRPKQVVQVAAPAAAASGEAMHTLIGGSPTKEKALATLKVLEGPRGLIGETFNITKAITIIGRNPKVAHIVFYPDEPSSVSRLHCTIQLDGKQFIITDNNSSSGSRINGDWLKPNDPVQLRDGDEIILGDLAKLGVKLVFNMQAAAESKEAIDRTFIIDDFHQDEFNKFKE